MLRRRSSLALVSVTVLITVMVTVGVTYAVQSILNTKTISASATIQSSGSNLFVCAPTDSFCQSAEFTGPLDFGTLAPGASSELSFYIFNSSISELLFADFRIDPLGPPVTLLDSDFGFPAKLTGTATGLGTFTVRRENVDTLFAVDATADFGPLDRAKFYIEFTADAGLASGPVSFNLLIDAVDAVDGGGP